MYATKNKFQWKVKTIQLKSLEWSAVLKRRKENKGKGYQRGHLHEQENTGTLGELSDLFHNRIWTLYRTNRYNISNQFKYYSTER